MKNILKGLGFGFLALTLVIGVGAGSANAALTLGALTVTSGGALTLDGAADGTLAVGSATDAGNIAIGGALTTGTLTLGKTTQTGATVISGAATGGSTSNTLFANSTTANVTVGAALTTGNLTLGKSAQSSGITAIYGGTAAANTIFNNVIGGSIAMGNALTSGTMTLGNASQTGATTIYGGSTTNAVQINGTVGNVGSGEGHGVDVVASGTMASGDNLVGLNAALTTAGTAGKWASGVYGKVVQGTTQNVTGYLSGGEFEVVNTNTTGAMEIFPLVLDSNSSTYNHGDSAYIWAQDFGAAKMPTFLKVTGATLGTKDSTKMFSTGVDTTSTHRLKITVNGVTYWLLATTDAPED